MSVEKVGTLIVGAGQAGLAMSAHLRDAGVSHLLLERNRIAEQWRTGRWDSLVANGPAWHDRFPTMDFSALGVGPEAFAPKEKVADYFEAFARQIEAPVRCSVTVNEVRKIEGQSGFRVETSQGVIEADNIVCATGPFQRPIIPPVVAADTAVMQMHSAEYRNPDQLPEGAVMVVGAGSSGTQIAEELMRSGRRVYLSVGPHERPPRAYRGRDFCWWLGVLGKWEAVAQAPGTEHVTIAVSGANGGNTVDFRCLAAQGMTLVGRTESCEAGVLRFSADVAANVAGGDASYLGMLDEADAYAAHHGLDLPEEPEARELVAMPACLSDPLLTLNLAEAGVGTIIWATGFARDYSWLKVDAFDQHGQPAHQRGVSTESGIYFLGLPWQSRRGSSFIWGVWHDAKHLADQIIIQRQYQDYHANAQLKKV